jgi:hypothetical protein
MKFTDIKLANGKYGAWAGQGLKLADDYYVTDSHFAFNTTDADNTTVNEDYYVVWNKWPVFSGGSNTDRADQDVSSTDLNDIGITNINTRTKTNHASSHLDCAIIRKSDRKAVHVKITGENATHYKTGWVANATITAIDPSDGPWSPEIGRLVNMGYIG